jgi:NAD(P)-dependent dehydrogenase (short-subunit alcohol dehydrogenase family)
MADLTGRKFVVTGGAAGIGQATVRRLLHDGASVYTADKDEGADLQVDVSAPGAAEAIVTAAEAAMGGIDGVIPCAGICVFGEIEGHGDALWDRTMAVNVTAAFRIVRAAVPALRQSGRGRIVLIGSVMSSRGSAGLVAYTVSKHAVLGMARAMAAELSPHGITVNCVQPGSIKTPMTKNMFTDPELAGYWERKAALRRLGEPEDIADVIAFLVSDDARFMTGHGVIVDGGVIQQP